MKLLKNEPMPSQKDMSEERAEFEAVIESMEIGDCVEFDTDEETYKFYKVTNVYANRHKKDYRVCIRRKYKRVWKAAKKENKSETDNNL